MAEMNKGLELLPANENERSGETDLDAAELIARAGDRWAAWQEPAFSNETIAADPWTAVLMPIPADAGADLLAHARDTARQMIDAESLPTLVRPEFSPEANREAAIDRLAELDLRLAPRLVDTDAPILDAGVTVSRAADDDMRPRDPWGRNETLDELEARHWNEYELVHGAYGVEELPSQLTARHEAELADWHARGPLSREAIAHDPSPTVARDLPDERVEVDPEALARTSPAVKAEIATDILAQTSDMDNFSTYDIRPQDGGFALVQESIDAPAQVHAWTPTLGAMHDKIITDDAPFYLPELVANLNAGELEGVRPVKRESELVTQLNALLGGELEPGRDPVPEGPDYNLRPGERIASTLGEQFARVVDNVLHEVTSFFWPEPAMTPEQTRDYVRAYDERAEQREVERAADDRAVALDAVNVSIAYNQARDIGGRDPSKAETVFDRYPGLTRDSDPAERYPEQEPEISDGFGRKL